MEPKLPLGVSSHYLSLHVPEPNPISDNRQDCYSVLHAQQPGLESRTEPTTRNKKETNGESVHGETNEPKKTENGCKKNGKGAQETGESEKNNGKSSETFWTVCPYCYNMYEYEKAYEEYCLRCQNCRRAFHGVAVVEPNKNILVEGKDEYYCGLGFFGLKYSLNGSHVGQKKSDQKKKERDIDGKSYNVYTVVEISDDSDDDGEAVNVKNDGSNGKASDEEDKEVVLKGNVEGMMQGSGKTEVSSGGRKRNVKSVARKSKKLMGRGSCVKNRKNEAGSASGTRDVCSESDLEFFEKNGDIFVGIKSPF